MSGFKEERLPGEIEPPKKPFLGLFSKGGTIYPIEPNAVMAIVLDATKPETIYPMALTKVSLKALTFACACGDPECSAIYTYTASRQGRHPIRR